MLNTRSDNNFGISDGPNGDVFENTTCNQIIEEEIEADNLHDIKIEIKEEFINDSEAGTCVDTPECNALPFDYQEYNFSFCKNYNNHNAAQDLAVKFIDKNVSMLEGLNQHGGKAVGDKHIFKVDDLIDISMHTSEENLVTEIDDVFVEEGYRSENIGGKLNKTGAPKERTLTLNVLHQIDDKIIRNDDKSEGVIKKDDVKDWISTPELAIKNIKVKYFDTSSNNLITKLEEEAVEKSLNGCCMDFRKTSEYEEKLYCKLFGIPEICVNLERVNLRELQKLCKENGYTESHASCPFITKIKQNPIEHVNLHREQPKIKIHKCSYCNFSTYSKSYMKKHIKYLHHKDEAEIFHCEKCSFKTVYRSTLKYHQRIHSQARQFYKCPLCPFQTAYPRVLRTSHALLHKSDAETRVFNCARCSFKGKTKDGMVRHQLVHRRPDELVMFKCDKCSYQTRHRGGLRRHVQVHKAPEELDMIPCNLCSYKARTKDHMRQHMKNHLSPDKIIIYKCKECSYQSKHPSTFKRHSLIHMKVEDIIFHYCDRCKFKGKTKDSLKTHITRVHDAAPKEPEWFKCDQCGFQFSKIFALKRHLVLHKYSGEMAPKGLIKANMFYCYNCPYFTKSKNDLKSHMPMHSNIFKHCKLCEFKTRYHSCFTRHMRTRHHL